MIDDLARSPSLMAKHVMGLDTLNRVGSWRWEWNLDYLRPSNEAAGDDWVVEFETTWRLHWLRKQTDEDSTRSATTFRGDAMMHPRCEELVTTAPAAGEQRAETASKRLRVGRGIIVHQRLWAK